MASIRRGWQQEKPQPATNDTAAPSEAKNSETPKPSSGSGSMIGKFLGRRTEANASPTSGSGRQSPANRVGPSARLSTRPRAGSVDAQPSAKSNQNPGEGVDYSLPGLGGSPLPSSAAVRSDSAKAAASNISRELTNDYGAPGSTTNAGTASSRNAPAGQAPMASATVAPRTASVRQSPQRRSTSHLNPDELRNEFSFSETLAESTSSGTPTTTDSPQPNEAITPTDVSAATPFAEPVAESAAPTTANSQTFAPAGGGQRIRLESAPPGSTVNLNPESSGVANRSVPFDKSESTGTGQGNTFTLRETLPDASQDAVKPQTSTPTLRSQMANVQSGSSAARDAIVLASNQTPLIATDIRGPKQILIGREAAYRIQLRNQGEVAAEGIVARIGIPSWADVVDTSATQGVIGQAGTVTGSGTLEWELPRLEAQSNETLEIRLIPRASRPLELGVSWTVTPVGSRVVVEVQEPKLQMSVSGPDEVMFGQPQVFRLTLTNPGTGVAENVKVDLMPPGGGEQVVTTQPIGSLPPGASRTVEVELTPKEAGKLYVKATAVGEGGLTSEASKEVFCRKAELELDWRGPETKYAGTPATYYFRVRNPGTAPAENVVVRVTLPDGAEFAGASEGQSYDAKRREAAWQIGTLSPGDDNYMELRCVVNTPGVNQFRIAADASTGNLSSAKLAETNVVALADLKLDVSDPSGPVAVGDQAVYEIRVVNRGASVAREVNVAGLFSEGLEPEQVEGAMYTVADGRVSFRTIDELQAGREIVLRIRARAARAGTHVFRAEVLCKDLEIKLAAEETTRFYADDAAPETIVPPKTTTDDTADQPAVPAVQ